MKESTLKKELKKHWKPCHITTVEGSNTFGMPDTYISTPEGSSWVELKVKYGKFLYFRPNQLVWMEKELQLNHDWWIIWHESVLFAIQYSKLKHWEMHSATNTRLKVAIGQNFASGSFQAIKKLIFNCVHPINVVL